MRELVYPPAGLASPAVFDRLAERHAEAGHEPTDRRAPLPEARAIELVVGVAFWASLRRDEGQTPRISLAWLPRDDLSDAMVLAAPVPFEPRGLTRLAPALDRPGIHLCVALDTGNPYVWGAVRDLPQLCFVVQVVDPGVVVAKYQRDAGRGKFGNLAVFEGDQVKVVDEAAASATGTLSVLSSLTPVAEADLRQRRVDAMEQLALSMRAHGRGGTLLIVPETSDWQASIVAPIPYRMARPFTRLADLVDRLPDPDHAQAWLDELRAAIAGLAGVTAVDGATVMNARFELLAFGAMIRRTAGAAEVREAVLFEPIAGHTARMVGPDVLGGARHLSAAQFVHDQPGALALVASQDGPFTIFFWSTELERLEAHRIETLLL